MDIQSYNNFQHNLRQPLNAISLSIANLRIRLEPHLEGEEVSYARSKFDKIDEEIQRLAKMLDEFAPL